MKYPRIDIGVQEEIADILGTANKLKDDSKRILETTKRAVEIAIEEGEPAAITFLDRVRSAS